MATEQRYFYHCFPRKRMLDVDLGLRILELVVKHGFVLAPEVISWDEPVKQGRGPTLKKLQRRICFTQLPKFELKDHCATFGQFAIQYSYEAMRGIGGIPVFYVPQNRGQEVALDSIGSALACRLHLIRTFFKNLIDLKNTIQAHSTKLISLKTPTFEGDIFARDAKVVIDYLSLHPFSFEEFFFSIDAVQNLLLPTENPNFTEDLAYYRQREWRIIENYAQNNERLAKDPTEEQKSELIGTLREFFEKEFTDENGSTRRLADLCLFYPAVAGKHVLAFATNVLVPPSALSRTQDILSAHGIGLPVLDIEAYYTF